MRPYGRRAVRLLQSFVQLADRHQTIYVEATRGVQRGAVDRLGFLFDA
jgi:hypothetical protein